MSLSGNPDDAGTQAPSNFRRTMRARLDQYARTWYFLRRNTLAMVGLIILLLFAVTWVYALTYPASVSDPQMYCASNGPVPVPAANPCYDYSPTVCTYPPGELPPGPGCYQTPAGNPSYIAPTLKLSPLGLGAFPFGSLVYPPGDRDANDPFFYNTYDLLLKGTLVSITVSIVIVGIGASLGLILGALSGFFGGLIDEAVMRITDIFLSVPPILLVIAVIVVGKTVGLKSFDQTLELIAGAFIITWWPTYARIVRSQSLVVREQRYVEAARASGAKSGRILRKHVIPNSMYPVLVQVSLDVGTVPLLLAAITFIGFVLFPYPLIPEWGSVAAAGAEVLTPIFEQCGVHGAACIIPWWQILFPGLAIFFFAISVNFFSDGLRDALDPRLRR
jgi:peptide/nickel transport system permease protein